MRSTEGILSPSMKNITNHSPRGVRTDPHRKIRQRTVNGMKKIIAVILALFTFTALVSCADAPEEIESDITFESIEQADSATETETPPETEPEGPLVTATFVGCGDNG